MSDAANRNRPELPEGWVEKAAGEILNFEYGKGLPAGSRVEGEVGVYASAGRVGFHDEALADEDVIVVGRKGAAGNAFLAEGPAWIIDTAYYATVPDEHDIRFLTYQLQTAGLSRLDQSTAIPSLSRDDLRRVLLRLPPLDEQQRIVSQVEGLMAGLATARRSLEAADRNLVFLRRAVVDRAADPDQWELHDLGDLLAVGLMNGRSVPTADHGFPVLRLTALRKGRVDLEQSKTGAWTASEASPYLVRGGDFLVARGNGSLSLVGRGGLVEHRSPSPVAFPDTVIRVQVEEDTIRREYLRLIWDSRLIREQIEEQAHTSAGIYKINQTMLRALRLPVPPIAEQDRLVRRARESLSRLDELESILHRQSVAGDRLQRSVLRAVCMGGLDRTRQQQAPRMEPTPFPLGGPVDD